ncbi:MAG: glycosyltransferase N-terminal domain-containing protein [Ferruginibacter sp.]
MSLFLYKLSLFFINAGLQVAALWKPKAKLWVKGRQNLLENLEAAFSGNQAPVIWIHTASLGEFEQGRPVIERIKKEYPGHKIVLSFFSPSGYENKKDYKGANHILYLPIDRPLYAKKFINIINPTLVIWIKYEYWYYYLTELKHRNIPVILVSALFRPGQPFFAWYGKIWREMLSCFTHIFVQNRASEELLKAIHISNVSSSGDTRYDRVTDNAAAFEPLPAAIEEFCGNHPVLVAGSTWAEDEEELMHYTKANTQTRFIIAPHEIDPENMEEVKKRFAGALIFSKLNRDGGNELTGNVLIIDNIGMLSRLYKYAHITYVGGGFGDDGLHNILEPAVFGRPVIFGPNHDKYPEAQAMIDCGGAFSVENALELEALLKKLFEDKDHLDKTAAAAKNFIYQNRGATNTILQYISEKKLL